MEKIKSIYIICFIIQVISLPVIGFLLFPMILTTFYQSFYCAIDHQKVNETYWEEFRKLFPNDYGHYCNDASFSGIELYVFALFCWVILFIILIIYIINFCHKIKDGLRLDKSILNLFICSLVFLLPVIIFYFYLTPGKTSFDKPEIIYIFDTQLNKRIEEKVKTIVERKIYGVIGLLLNFIVIGTTLAKIYILKKGKEQKDIDAKFITDQINQNI